MVDNIHFVKHAAHIFNYSIVSSSLHATAQRTGLPQDKLNILFAEDCYPKTTMQRLTQWAVKACCNQAFDKIFEPVKDPADPIAQHFLLQFKTQ